MKWAGLRTYQENDYLQNSDREGSREQATRSRGQEEHNCKQVLDKDSETVESGLKLFWIQSNV